MNPNIQSSPAVTLGGYKGERSHACHPVMAMLGRPLHRLLNRGIVVKQLQRQKRIRPAGAPKDHHLYQ